MTFKLVLRNGVLLPFCASGSGGFQRLRLFSSSVAKSRSITHEVLPLVWLFVMISHVPFHVVPYGCRNDWNQWHWPVKKTIIYVADYSDFPSTCVWMLCEVYVPDITLSSASKAQTFIGWSHDMVFYTGKGCLAANAPLNPSVKSCLDPCIESGGGLGGELCVALALSLWRRLERAPSRSLFFPTFPPSLSPSE